MMEQTGGGMDMNLLMQRVRRVFTLDATVFDELRMDRHATVQAVVAAVGAIVLFGVGGWLWYVINNDSSFASSGEMFVKSLLLGSILASALWFAWVAITYVTLTQLFHARADLNELARVMGFAAVPLASGLLMFLPFGLDFAIGLLAVVVMFGSTLIAVQSSTDAGPGRSLVAVAAGFFVWALVLSLFVTTENIYAPGFFIFDIGGEILRS